MQKKTGIVIFILMLLVIVAIPYYMSSKQINSEKVKEEVTEDTNVSVFALDIKTVSRIEIKDDSALILEKRGKEWQESEYTQLAYNNSAITELVDAVSRLQSTQMIRNVNDQKKYGIDENSRMITLYDEANNHYTLHIGKYTENKDSLYITTDLLDTVYIVKNEDITPLFYKKDDIIDKELTTPAAGAVESIEIIKKDEPSIRIEKNPQTGYKDYETWLVKDFFHSPHEVHTETVSDIISQIEAFQKDGFIGSDSQMAQYGLDAPAMTVALNEDCTVKFGNREDGFIYFMYNKEPYIYKMSEDKVKVIGDLKPITFIRKQVYIPDLSKLKGVTITNPEETLTVAVQNATSKGSENSLVSQVGDVLFDESETQKLLQLLEEDICIEAQLQNPEIEQKQERKAEISVTYQYADQSTETIELIPYDNNFYILRFENEIEFAVGKEKVMNMFTNLNEMIKSSTQKQ